MITVTEGAAEELNRLITEADDRPDNNTLRLGFSPQGKPVLGWDEPQDQDHKVEHETETVLVVDPTTGELLEGAVMDVAHTPEGPRLSLSPAKEGGREGGEEEGEEGGEEEAAG